MSFEGYLRRKHEMEENNTGFDEETKRKIFSNANGRCEYCGVKLVFDNHVEGLVGAWDPHHVIPKKDGGDNSVGNGAALCLDCHKNVHASKATTLAFAKILSEKRKGKKG